MVEARAAAKMAEPLWRADTRRALRRGGKAWSRYVFKMISSVTEPKHVDDRTAAEFDQARDIMLAAPACCLYPAEKRIRDSVSTALALMDRLKGGAR